MSNGTFERLSLSAAPRTVWIFGAGASHTSPYDLPLQKDMLRHFMTRPRPGNPGAQESLARLRDEVKQLISFVLPGATHDTVVLEDLFSAYELQAWHLRSSSEEIQRAAKAIRTLQQALFISVQEFGRGDSAKWKPHRRDDTRAPYAELFERLFSPTAEMKEIRRHTLATMNYDINIDRCAINMRDPAAGDIDLDYGFELADYRIPDGFLRPRDRSILLLRLHGSVNWLRCLACQAVFTTVTNQATIVEREDCYFCRTRSLDRILVHPSYLRTYSDPILQLTWGRLQEELTSSDRWVFIGYSLPDADIHLRDVLRHALRVRKRNGDPTEVVWVGYRSSQQDTAWDAEHARYRMMFANHLSPWNATSGGFADFLQRIDD